MDNYINFMVMGECGADREERAGKGRCVLDEWCRQHKHVSGTHMCTGQTSVVHCIRSSGLSVCTLLKPAWICEILPHTRLQYQKR